MSNLDKRAPIGVGVLILNEDGQFLLGRRKGAHEPGTWAFPGGKPDPGEHPTAAAIREVEEETGICLSTDPDSFATLPIWTYDRFEDYSLHYVTLYFIAVVEDGQEPEVREPDKCEEWRWFNKLSDEPVFAGVAEVLSVIWEAWT